MASIAAGGSNSIRAPGTGQSAIGATAAALDDAQRRVASSTRKSDAAVFIAERRKNEFVGLRGCGSGPSRQRSADCGAARGLVFRGNRKAGHEQHPRRSSGSRWVADGDRAVRRKRTAYCSG